MKVFDELFNFVRRIVHGGLSAAHFCLGVTAFLLLGEKGRYTGASICSSASRCRGLYRCDVVLEAVPSESPLGDLRPREAWLETIFECFESISLRKCEAGVRLCIGFDNGPELSHSVTVTTTCAGCRNPAGSCWSGDLVTFEFCFGEQFSAAGSEWPYRGEVTIANPETGQAGTYRFSIPVDAFPTARPRGVLRGER